MRPSASLILSAYLLTLVSPALAQTTVDGQTYDNAIDYVTERDILPVMADGEFHPEHGLTRMDLIRSIVLDVYGNDVRNDCYNRIAPRNPYTFTHLFTDIAVTNYSAREICVGMLVGIVEGNPDGSFGSLQTANLVEVAKVVTKAYGIAPKPSLRLQSGIPWHEPFWYALAKRNAIPDTVKSRDAVITRGEYAEILYKIRGERPAQGFHYRPTMVKDLTQADAAPVLMSVELPQNLAPALFTKAPDAKLSSGLMLQLHTEERRQNRLGVLQSKWIGRSIL
jgi:hypothetical protein